jgi:hypothetical protein
MNEQDETTEPLRLPLARPDAAAARAAEKLKGHSTSADWLPQGLWPALDRLRAEHLRLRGQVADELAALAELNQDVRDEDAAHAERLREAHRAGRPDAVDDLHTPEEERTARHAAIEQRLWDGVVVLSEATDAVIEAFREHEDEWLADLRRRLEGAQEKRREAQRLLAEAQADEFHVHMLGQWSRGPRTTARFGRQPALSRHQG